MNFRVWTYFLFLIGLLSCDKETGESTLPSTPSLTRSVDLSSLPEIKDAGTRFYDEDGQEGNMLEILKDAGVNTIRLRLWVNPASIHSSLSEVKAFSSELQQMGFTIWLCLHYSDTWADPGHQAKPGMWKESDYSELLDSVYHYTSMVAGMIQPEIIQIGNEINNGFLHPEGHRDNTRSFHKLLEQGILAVRDASASTEIMLHHAGHENAEYFYRELDSLDFDLIGISYYPIWHGKSLDSLEGKLTQLHQEFNRNVLIAETAYPFTLGYNDWTNNIVGLPEQLIPGFEATKSGQSKYMMKIRMICEAHAELQGFCFWGAELVAWKGPQATDGSPWENQALFDFDHKALEALEAFHP